MKNSIWMRLLALMLVCGLMLGCLVGCGDDAGSDSDEKEKEDKLSELRDDLVKYKYQGLLVYLGDDMSELEYGYSSNEDDTLFVSVEVMDPEDIEMAFGDDITSAKTLAAAAEDRMNDLDSEEVLDSGKKNGNYYLYGAAEDEQGVMGFYYQDGYAWIVTVIFEDEDLKDTAIKYATLCEVVSAPKLDEESTDRPADRPNQPSTQAPSNSENEDPGDYDEPTPEVQHITLKVWVPAHVVDGWLQNRMDAFQEEHPEYSITWEVFGCSEGDILSLISADPEDAADVFLFANDQIGSLVSLGAIAPLDGKYRGQVINDNSATMINSVTDTDGEIYGFPISPNTWFMYYDKRVFSESDVKSLDTMLANGRVAFDITNGWYNGAFFFGAGTTLFGTQGNDPYAGIDFGSKGVAVAQKMLQMYETGNLVNANGWGSMLLMDGTADACFSGSWDYEGLKDALGDHLGVAALPTFTVDGRAYQMKAFAGSKAVGVNGMIYDTDRAALAMEFAAFLATAESQEIRLENYGMTPTHVDLENAYAVRSNPIAQAELEVINHCSIVQPVIAAMGGYWTPMANFGAAISNGTATYENIGDLLDQTEDQINSY